MLTEKKLDIDSYLFNNRIIKIWGNIDTNMSEYIVTAIKVLDFQNQEPIQVWINSNGGEVDAGLAIIDVMDIVKSRIETVVVGKAYSMGAIIASCGDLRKATKHSKIMLHQPSVGSLSGKETDITNYVSELTKTKRILLDLLKSKTHKTLKQLEKDMEQDFYLTALEAKEYGLIDEILEKDI